MPALASAKESCQIFFAFSSGVITTSLLSSSTGVEASSTEVLLSSKDGDPLSESMSLLHDVNTNDAAINKDMISESAFFI